MKEFRVPDDWLPPEMPSSFSDFSTLLGSPTSRWTKGLGFGPFPSPTAAASGQPRLGVAGAPGDPDLVRVSESDLDANDDDVQFVQQQTPSPAKPSWQRAVEAIEAVMAQRAQGFPRDIAPPVGSPAVVEAQAKQAAAIATAVSAGGTAGTVGGGLAGMAARAAPALVAAGAATTPVVAAALPFLLIPTNSQSGTIDLSEGLRARFAPGQRTASIERRVDNGLLGSGLGARWEKLPVAATIGAGADGRQTVFVDHGQLERAIGAGAAAALLRRAGVAGAPHPSGVPLPIILEIRIGGSTDAGMTTSLREATREEIMEVCPNFAEYERLALEAAKKAQAAGLQNGLDYGNRVHEEVEAELRKMSKVQKMLRDRGIHKLRPEIALLAGVRKTYYPKGSSRLDVLELHKRKTVCVYDFKTGNARFPDATIMRYAREAGLYAKAVPNGYTHIYVVPIRVP